MAACTYPNHASFATGAAPETHGIVTNHVLRDGQVLGAWEVGPRGPTIFDSYGDEASAVLGDHHLVHVMGAQAAASHWPLHGQLPAGIELDPLGYPADGAVMPMLVEALAAAPRLVVGYLGSIDTYSHLFGPSSEEADAAYRRVDTRIAEIEEALAWGETVVVVVSDHIQHTAADRPGIDLRSVVGEGTFIIDEGSAALVGALVSPERLMDCDGVAGAVAHDEQSTLVWCEPGRYFGPYPAPPLRGVHGNEASRTQLAMVTGGHPARSEVAELINAGPVPATAWAGVLAELLSSV